MRSSALAALALAASASAAAIKKRAVGGETVLYWGNNDSEQDLTTYCTNQGVDVVILAFLSNYGQGVAPAGYIGSCYVDSGSSDSCDSVASAISTCQSNGIKVFLSLGGAGATGTMSSEGDANGVAYTLWNSFANPAVTASGSNRPFGNSFVNGWDFDIESNPDGNQQYYQYAINTLRGYFSSDSSNTYYISGAPQCVVPDANMADMINEAQFDYINIQYYNTPDCAAYQVTRGDPSQFTFDQWYQSIQGNASASAKLTIGLPGSQDAADNDEDYFISVDELPTLINEYGTHSGWGGVMIYDGGASDETNDNGCHYDQEVHSVLTTGNTC